MASTYVSLNDVEIDDLQVYGERDDPDELDQVAIDDRPAVAGHQVDQEPVRETTDRHQDWTEGIS